jgi:hypothetical protein
MISIRPALRIAPNRDGQDCVMSARFTDGKPDVFTASEHSPLQTKERL